MQIPGSRGKQGGVLTLLKEISKREGFRGLYRYMFCSRYHEYPSLFLKTFKLKRNLRYSKKSEALFLKAADLLVV